MTLALRYAVRSDVGLLREGNEDSAYAGPRLLAVADGMGGHAAGEVASAVAISVLTDLDEDLPAGELLNALAEAVTRGQLEAAAADDPSFGQPLPPQTSADGTITLVRFPFAGEATDNSSEAAVDAITQMRETYVPQAFGPDSGVLVGGDTATVKDFFDISAQYTPIIILLVLGLSFILLTVVFRSIVVPLKNVSCLSAMSSVPLLFATEPEPEPEPLVVQNATATPATATTAATPRMASARLLLSSL